MITIFTPTYNRCDLLKRLYKSLCEQTNNDFEWLVIDDCSVDATEEYVKTLSTDNFPIRYYKTLKNSGKHGAYNLAIELSKGEWFVCVDSDDYLKSNAIEIILEDVNLSTTKEIGYVYPQVNTAINNTGWDQVNNMMIDIIDTERVYGIKETAIVIKTSVLKKHRFPIFEIDGRMEKFCTESILYDELIADGQFKAINKEFYVGDYQNDGLSKNIKKLWLDNPNGFLYYLNEKFKVCEKYKNKNRIIGRVYCILELNAFCIKKEISILRNTPSILYSMILFLPGVLVSIVRYK